VLAFLKELLPLTPRAETTAAAVFSGKPLGIDLPLSGILVAIEPSVVATDIIRKSDTFD
jgi:hypothetical protein